MIFGGGDAIGRLGDEAGSARATRRQLGAWVLGYAISGWTSTLAVILVLGSTQLMILGIMGEYLGRMYMESKRRPLFIVDEVHGSRSARNAVHHLHDTLKDRVNGKERVNG